MRKLLIVNFRFEVLKWNVWPQAPQKLPVYIKCAKKDSKFWLSPPKSNLESVSLPFSIWLWDNKEW